MISFAPLYRFSLKVLFSPYLQSPLFLSIMPYCCQLWCCSTTCSLNFSYFENSIRKFVSFGDCNGISWGGITVATLLIEETTGTKYPSMVAVLYVYGLQVLDLSPLHGYEVIFHGRHWLNECLSVVWGHVIRMAWSFPTPIEPTFCEHTVRSYSQLCVGVECL